MNQIWKNGMMGVVLGDCLGMPVQFLPREEIKKNPVKTMEGYGTYNMPPGTWSDDSSMALATLFSLKENNRVDYDDIMKRFVCWVYNGEYTPAGVSFDMGNTCLGAINEYIHSKNYLSCGKTGERANGNGALMRIMPICLYAYERVKKEKWTIKNAMDHIHQTSALTHNHLRSKMACGIYFFMVCSILDKEGTLQERLQAGVDDAIRFYHGDIANYTQLAYYSRLFHLDELAECQEPEIKSTGYVVDSLEAAVWSLITTDSLKEALLRAVNLGDDTDTIGAIAGLAGLYYGYESAPEEWRTSIIKEADIMELCEIMEEKQNA
ncbi:MAG: ADP-ribosylglycohydrolase family protein [Lachnospiraceae bacterium]|nr:ADP-ribosylglycohydrolase family protein [Lachnospiraceae bacterium]